MTRRHEVALGAAIVVWLIVLALMYLLVMDMKPLDQNRCGTIGGCGWRYQ